MSKTSTWIICLFSLMLAWNSITPSYAANTTYYVSSSQGADSNTGLSATPGSTGSSARA
jgi:hypothetical protein